MLSIGRVCGYVGFLFPEAGIEDLGQEQAQEETKVEMPMPKKPKKTVPFSSFKASSLRVCVFSKASKQKVFRQMLVQPLWHL